MHIILALGRLRQEEHYKIKVNPSYIVISKASLGYRV